MRVLVTIAHYYHPEPSAIYGSLSEARTLRAAALRSCLLAWRTLFGPRQGWAHLDRPVVEPANARTRLELTLVVCTIAERHVLDDLGLPRGSFLHAPVDCPPLQLGFACQSILREVLGSYDYYVYSEDDLVLHDPWFFRKLEWFTESAGTECLLQPNRYELASDGAGTKLYIDGDVEAKRTTPYHDVLDRPELSLEHFGQQIRFGRTGNPHAGCYFLTSQQMRHWAEQRHFLNRDCSFYSALESAATLGIMQTFRIYKPMPEVANFLEIQHCGDAWVKKIERRNAAMLPALVRQQAASRRP